MAGGTSPTLGTANLARLVDPALRPTPERLQNSGVVGHPVAYRSEVLDRLAAVSTGHWLIIAPSVPTTPDKPVTSPVQCHPEEGR